MKLLRGFLKFPCLKPNNHVLLFMLDFIRQSLGLGLAWYMNFLVWICLDIVYQLNWMLTRWHKMTMCIGFSFFFEFLCPFESWSNSRFDHDLIKFKTWIWKIKHLSFLVTPICSSWEGFWNFHAWKPKTTFLHACLTS